jgi:2-polyprenyl-6-methoxyphenol hydroxylase-like FAD-dependent oxidoreductase
VVIGASLAGVLAARSLTVAYDRVTLIDRDEMPHEPATRGGVPQGRHTHGLLARGREVIEDLFPGTTADLVARGALLGDAQRDGRWHVGPQPLATGRSGLDMLLVSRPSLEWYLRHRLLADRRVEVLEHTSVVDLALTGDDARVNGVIACTSGARVPRLVPADLVVDASGRTSRTPEWLERRGYPVPPEEVRRVDKHYVTRQFQRRPGDGPLAYAVPATPAVPRGGIMLAQEGGRWIVSLTGLGAERPPQDLEGFLAYAHRLSSPVIGTALDGLVPLDVGCTYRFPANRRRRYEQVAAFPAGLVVTGDALCAFDPVHGQGMTVAALEAAELRDLLRDGPPPRGTVLGTAFHRRAARHIDTPWQIAAGAAPRPLAAYLRRLLAGGAADPVLARAFLRVQQMADRPSALLRPRITARVVRGVLRPSGSRPSRGGDAEQRDQARGEGGHQRRAGDAAVVGDPRQHDLLDQRGPAAHHQPYAG